MSPRNDPPISLVLRSLRVRYLVLLDFVLICLSVLLAVALRLENLELAWNYLLHGGWMLLVLATTVRLPLYLALNLYNRLWRYASSSELTGIMQAGLIAPLVIGLFNFGLLPPLGIPSSGSRSIFLMEAILSFFMLGGLRILLRFIQLRRHQRHDHTNETPAAPALIVGAGDAGAMILREIQRNPGLGMQVIGFLDDDANKHGNALSGVPVLGEHTLLPALVREHDIRQVIIAMPTAPGKVIRHVVQLCEGVNIQPRTVPRLDALVNGNLTLDQLRAVEIDDLLRREPVAIDQAGVRVLLQGKRVLVTGGGGSIGRELCRQILTCQPSELVIVGHGENSIFEVDQELARLQAQNGTRAAISLCIADIRMPERMVAVFKQYRPDVIFHAAAHKHVPLMEANPFEAVTNNILGTHNVLLAAEATNVSHFIMVSTDKAVNPTSVMGVSKRAAELLVLETARRTGKPYVAVRFGNVLGSRGSVVLTFRQQIAAGGPVTITHPEVRRFFMTIPEAVQLLLQAAVLGCGGEVFMLDMGEPVRILDLATDLIRLSGLEVGRDIDIVFSGLRPGEKLYEELFLEGETYHTTAHPKLRIAGNAGRFVPENLRASIANLEVAAYAGDRQMILHLLHALVPEYQLAPQPANGQNEAVQAEKASPSPGRAPEQVIALLPVRQGMPASAD